MDTCHLRPGIFDRNVSGNILSEILKDVRNKWQRGYVLSKATTNNRTSRWFVEEEVLNSEKILPGNQFNLGSLSRCLVEDFMIARTWSYVLFVIPDCGDISDVYSEFYDSSCNYMQVFIHGVLFHQIVGIVWHIALQ